MKGLVGVRESDDASSGVEFFGRRQPIGLGTEASLAELGSRAKTFWIHSHQEVQSE
jgi:hypothetical protein